MHINKSNSKSLTRKKKNIKQTNNKNWGGKPKGHIWKGTLDNSPKLNNNIKYSPKKVLNNHSPPPIYTINWPSNM